MNTVLKSIFVATLLFIANIAVAGNRPVTGSEEIQTILAGSFANTVVDTPTSVNVTFTITAKHEIVVLNTNNAEYDAKIKNALNYKRMNATDLTVGKTYVVPVELVAAK